MDNGVGPNRRFLRLGRAIHSELLDWSSEIWLSSQSAAWLGEAIQFGSSRLIMTKVGRSWSNSYSKGLSETDPVNVPTVNIQKFFENGFRR